MHFLEALTNSVLINGKSVKEIYGHMESWLSAKEIQEAKNVRSLLMPRLSHDKAIKLTFSGATEDELNQ